ncbi:MAG: DUF4168 domain-containing protein [Acidiferrobacter sp.]
MTMDLSRPTVRLTLALATMLTCASAYAYTAPGGASTAGAPGNTPPPSSQSPMAAGASPSMPTVTHTVLLHFVAAIRHVSKIRATYAKKMELMKAHPATLPKLQAKARHDMVAAIKAQSLTLPQYNNLVQQADTNPGLRARVLHMLHQ